MIPKNKKIAILHPYMNNIWWAVKMMIFLWNFLQGKWNEVCFYTTYFDKELFKNFLQIEVKVLSKFKISYQIRKYDYIIIWNSPMQFVWVLSKILFLSKAKILWWHHHYPWYYSENKGFQIFLKIFSNIKKYNNQHQYKQKYHSNHMYFFFYFFIYFYSEKFRNNKYQSSPIKCWNR